MTDIVESFVESLDMKKSSRATYHRAIRQFLDYTQTIGNPEPSRGVLKSYKKYLIEEYRKEDGKPIGANTVNLYLTVAHAYYTWLFENDYIQDEIAPVRGARVSGTPSRQPLTSREAYAMLNTHAERKIGKDIARSRDEAIIGIALLTGLREISIASLTVGNYDIRGNTAILYYKSKGFDQPNAFVVIVPELAKKINDYIAIRQATDPSEPLFISTSNNRERDDDGNVIIRPMTSNSIARIIRKYYQLNGIHNTPHALRTTCGTFAFLGGASVKECANLLNHSSTQTTERHYIRDVERIQGVGENAVFSFIMNKESERQAIQPSESIGMIEGTQ